MSGERRTGDVRGARRGARRGTGAAQASAKTGARGKTLYIIHGWTYTVEPWKSTLAELKKLGVNAKMLHVPGLTEKSSKVYTIEDYMRWADREIPDGAVALGHSNGGRILLNLCAEKPEKLKFLILLDSAGIYEPSMRKRIVEKIAKIGEPLKKIKLVDQAFHKITRSTDYAKAPANMKKTLTNMLTSDQRLNLGKVTTPTMILWGKEDRVTPPRQGTKMYEGLPNAELKFYAGWSHAPYISHPMELARVIAAVVERGPERITGLNKKVAEKKPGKIEVKEGNDSGDSASAGKIVDASTKGSNKAKGRA